MNRTKQFYRLTIAFGTCVLLAPLVVPTVALANEPLDKEFRRSQPVGHSSGELRRNTAQQVEPDHQPRTSAS